MKLAHPSIKQDGKIEIFYSFTQNFVRLLASRSEPEKETLVVSSSSYSLKILHLNNPMMLAYKPCLYNVSLVQLVGGVKGIFLYLDKKACLRNASKPGIKINTPQYTNLWQ